MQQFKHIQVKWRKKKENEKQANSKLLAFRSLLAHDSSNREIEVLEGIISVNHFTLQFLPLQRNVKLSCSC